MAKRPASNLKRRRHVREPKRLFILFCEGEKTEPTYFSALNRAYSNTLIKVEITGAAGVPYTLAGLAAECARSLGLGSTRKKVLNSFEKGDQVWAVFDRDEHPRFNEAVDLCRRKGVGIARSDPCFELWLVLHEEDFDKPGDRHAVQAHLRALRPEYRRDGAKTPDCADLVKRVEEAEKRAEKQLARREAERTPFGPPSTTVGQLTRAIREAADLTR